MPIECENCQHYAYKIRYRTDMTGKHPEKITYCDQGYQIEFGGQPGCEGSKFVSK